MSWSASQLRMLRAMGHEPMAWHDPSAVASGPATSIANPALSVAASAEPGLQKFPALLNALRMAAGDRDVSALAPDLDRLRREPAMKRALWPSLRALRRSH